MKHQIKILLFIFFVLFSISGNSQQLYKATGVEIDFFSSAPVEDINALSQEGISIFNATTGEISFQVKIRSFEFKKAKMQEHFNENFMESHEYPLAVFKGKIKDDVDVSEGGESKVTITGILEIHGIKRNREISTIIKTENDKITLKSQFKVACEDHDIEIPKILWKNIAEVVLVTVNANYSKM